jgi:hypothetical protein
MENVGCLFASVETFVDSTETGNAFYTKSASKTPHLHRNVCQFRSNASASTSLSVAVDTYLACRCLGMDYSHFQESCHNNILLYLRAPNTCKPTILNILHLVFNRSLFKKRQYVHNENKDFYSPKTCGLKVYTFCFLLTINGISYFRELKSQPTDHQVDSKPQLESSARNHASWKRVELNINIPALWKQVSLWVRNTTKKLHKAMTFMKTSITYLFVLNKNRIFVSTYYSTAHLCWEYMTDSHLYALA